MNIFKKLKEGLTKTRESIVAGFDSIFSGHKAINDDFYDELEEVMIMGDMGVRATDEILEDLRAKVKEYKIKDPAECRQLLIDTIKEKIDLGENAYEYENTRSVLLIIGVNGVGKTTSVGKLAASFKSKGKKVILAAADTFRAGAIDQLKIWGKRAGVDVVAQQEGADPGAVIFDAVQASKARGADILIADTAGRLHNKKNLMSELSKIDRIIEREYPDCYRENLIVLDATTGQNAISQLKEFNEVTDITGIILTKMDGTAKGGIIVAIQAEFGIPVKYIGVGERIEDLQKFDSSSFVNALFDVEISDDELTAFEQEEIDESLLAQSVYDEDTSGSYMQDQDEEYEDRIADTEPEDEQDIYTGDHEEGSDGQAVDVEPEEEQEINAGDHEEGSDGHALDDEPEDEQETYFEDRGGATEDSIAGEDLEDEQTFITQSQDEGYGEITENVDKKPFVESDDVSDGIFEDITDEDSDDYPDFEDVSDDEDDSESDGYSAQKEYHDKAYEAFMKKRRGHMEADDADEYHDSHLIGREEDLYDDEDSSNEDYDDFYDDQPKKRKGLFGIFRRK